MSSLAQTQPALAAASLPKATAEPAWVKWTLVTVALTFLTLFLVLPLSVVLYGAFELGVKVWWDAITEPDALAAIRLTLFVLNNSRAA